MKDFYAKKKVARNFFSVHTICVYTFIHYTGLQTKWEYLFKCITGIWNFCM